MTAIRFLFHSGEPENRNAVEEEINSCLEPVHALIEHVGLANFNGISFSTPSGWHISAVRQIFGDDSLAAFVSAPGDRRSITGRLLDEKWRPPAYADLGLEGLPPMTTDDPYARLAQLAAHLPTELDSAYMWDNLYEYDRGGNAPAPELIAEITHLYAVSPEGYGSQDIALLAQLTDGRWATCVAWSDTSGFDCRGQVDWRINDTQHEAVAFGLDQESRNRLGL